jgi:hypothetical protein
MNAHSAWRGTPVRVALATKRSSLICMGGTMLWIVLTAIHLPRRRSFRKGNHAISRRCRAVPPAMKIRTKARCNGAVKSVMAKNISLTIYLTSRMTSVSPCTHRMVILHVRIATRPRARMPSQR